jgi:exodeoxyribonuclease-5
MDLKHQEVLFMAFVGKATMALARKGNFAKTIHSSVYDLIDVPRIDPEGNIMQKNGRILTTFAFVRKEKLPDEVKLLVVDEGSMVAGPMAEDILSFGLPVVVLGDLDQLPPVFGSSYFLVKPDVILTQVMSKRRRSIIMLSQMAIKGLPFKVGDMAI